VAHMTDEIVDRLRELHEKMAEETLSVSFVDLNRSFHMAIYEAAVSPRLVSIIRSLEDAAVMYIGASLKTDAGLREAAVHDHAEILAALEARDADAAEAAIRRHLTLSLKALDNRVAKEADGSSR
jgi:DNA-binding GntR family transcriptional regulator